MATFACIRGFVGSRRLAQILGACLAVCLTCLPAFAQTDTGRILGGVTDKSGAVVPNANVTITDAERGTARTLTTNGAGEYLAPNLSPGQYMIRASAPGFKNIERRGIALEVAKDVRVDFSLEPGDTQTTVTVSEEAPLVDSTSSVLGGTLSNQVINDLPLNGRNFMTLLQMRPGVMAIAGGGKWSQSSNGLRPEYNVYILNGIDAIEGFSAQSALNAAGISGDTASLLPVDSIQEFNVQQNPKAEYGWKPGVVANIGLKSGTNTLHGTAYAFGRDGAWDARNPFIGTGVPKQETALEQFGATVGGAIKKDKLFYFLAYEGQRETIGAPATVSLPTTASLGSTASSLVDACKSVAAGSRSALSLAMAGMDTNCNVVSPQNNLFQSGPTVNFVPVIPMDVHSDNGLAKIDYNINERHNLNGELFMNSFGGLATQNQVHDYWRTATENQSRLGGIHYTWLPGPNLVNEAKFGINRVNQISTSGDCSAIGQPDTSYLHTGAQSCGFPQVSISGFSSLGCCSNFPKIQGPDHTYEFIDDASWTRGKHALKFGGEFRRMVYNGGTYRAGKGTFTFRANGATNALQTFIQGAPFRGVNFVGNPNVSISDWGYAGFFQDDWRITPRLTLNLGLRYEYVTPIQEANNQLANFDPTLGMVQTGKQIGSSPYQPDRNNFAPRVGFAWDVTGNGKTVVRGGGAIIYVLTGFNVLTSQQGTTAVTTGLNTSPTGGLLNGVQGPGTITAGAVTLTGSQLNWNLAGPIFPAGQITCTTAAPCPILAVDPNLRVPYVTSWNLGIQRQLTNNLALDVAYVGNHGSKLVQIVDINAAALGSGWIGNPSAASTALENQSRPFFSKFPYLSNINQIQNADRSNYDGLQTTLTERLSHGLNFTVGYTYSHAFDMSPGDWRGANVPMYSPNPNRDYAVSNYDIRHRFTTAITYALPQKKGFGQMLEGWQINTIVNIQSAAPWSLLDSTTDVSGTGEFTDRWNFTGNPSDFSNRGTSPIPFFAGTSNPACLAQASAAGAAGIASLTKWGCYVSGGSMLLPPALGTLGTMGQNIFRSNGGHLVDFSVTKKWKITERISTQFRAEFFNVLNQTQYANPAYNGAGRANPVNGSSGVQFGNSPATPDVQIANPQIGTGAARSLQLGLKVIF
jgi:hypothetical protein